MLYESFEKQFAWNLLVNIHYETNAKSVFHE